MGLRQSLAAHFLLTIPGHISTSRCPANPTSLDDAAGTEAVAKQRQELQRQESGLPLTMPQMTTQQVHSAETR